jgi:peptidoglycan hydrolase CwlO-like protein
MKRRIATNVAMVFIWTFFLAFTGHSFAAQAPEDKTTGKEVRQEVKEALEAVKNYSADKRDEAVKKVRIAIDDLDRRIENIESRIEEQWNQMDESAREQAQATLKTLRTKRTELAEWYGGMRHSSANAWEHVKKGFLASYKALSEAYDKAVKEF